MQHESWSELSQDERRELGERIAGGDIWNETEGEDCFDIALKCSGRNVSGRYLWESGMGEYEELTVE